MVGSTDDCGSCEGRKPSFLRRYAIRSAILGVLVMAGLVRNFLEFQAESGRLEAFEPHVASWADLSAYRPTGLPVAQALRVRGALAVLDLGTEGGSEASDSSTPVVHQWAHGQLPAVLRPATPESVRTVALLRTQWTHVGHYVEEGTDERTGEAWQGSVHLTLVDPVARTILYERDFEGAAPVASTRSDGDQTGGLPLFEVVDFLAGLPRG